MARGNPKNQRIELESPILNEFLATMKDKPSSREEHRNRLVSLERFVKQKFVKKKGNTLIDNNFVLNRLVGERKKAKGNKIYVYSFFSDYCTYLKENKPNISRKRVELLLHSARQAINLATDGIIRNDVYRLKVKNLPAKSKNMKTRLDHEDVVELILAIGNDLRLRTMVMLLAGSGLRVAEAIKTKHKYIKWDIKPPCINLPAEVSKTGVERNVILTGEMVKALRSWLDYKYRDRKIVRTYGNIVDYKKPSDIGESYIFKVREEYTMENYRFIYKMFQDPFKDIVEKTNLGKKYSNGRNSVTLHSLRWFTQTTVERVTKRDVVAYYWIGKEQKNYQWEPNSEEELNELYNLVEPHLTFLDSKIIDHNQQKQIADLEERLKKQEKKTVLLEFEKVIDIMIEENPQRVITSEQQLQYFIDNRSPRIKESDIELIKEMINDKEITDYQEESEQAIEFDNEAYDRYNYYNVVPEIPYTAEFDKSTGNLIVQFDDESKQSLILPPLPNSTRSTYPSGKVYFSTSKVKVKKMVRKDGYY